MLRKRHFMRSICLFPIVLVGLSGGLLYRAFRQEQIDFAFIAAVKFRNTAEALSLLRHGANINTRQPLDVPNSSGEYLSALFNRLCGRRVPEETTWSALMLAVSGNDTALTLALLNRGATGVDDLAGPLPSEAQSYPEPLLIIAASRGNVEIVRALLDHGAHAVAKEKSGVTALLAVSESLYPPDYESMKAAERRAGSQRYRAILRLLLDHGADLRARSRVSASALCDAVAYNQQEAIALLLDRGADPNAPEDRTPLQVAIENDNIQVAKILLARGAKANPTGVPPLVLTSNLALLRLLLDHGADPNARYDWNVESMQEDDETALIRAARQNRLPVVRLLLSRGADINETSNLGGKSALMLAARQGSVSAVHYLVDHGAAVNAHDKTGETALMLAAGEGSLSIVRCLLDHGAEIDAREKNGATALSFATEADEKSVIALLKIRGGKKQHQSIGRRFLSILWLQLVFRHHSSISTKVAPPTRCSGSPSALATGSARVGQPVRLVAPGSLSV